MYAYLALVDVARGYHRDHGIADAVSWMTLADLGRNLAIDRRMSREGWPVMQSWLTLLRGAASTSWAGCSTTSGASARRPVTLHTNDDWRNRHGDKSRAAG